MTALCAAPRHQDQDEPAPAEPFDWADAGAKFQAITAELMHGEGSDLRGAEFYAEVLRRLWARIGHQWVTTEHMAHVVDVNTGVSRHNAEQAQKTLAHFTAEYERKMREAAAECAKAIRARCNEVTVPSRYRREGVLLAADWLDGGTP